MHKRTSSLRLLIAVFAMLLITACKTANVSCAHIEKLTTGLGLLNVPEELIGNLIELDPVSKKTGFKGRLALQDGDISVTAGDSTTEIAQGSQLDIAFSADITKKIGNIAGAQASLESQVQNNLQLQLKNSQRHQLDQQDTVLNRNDNQSHLQSMIDQVTAAGHILVVVNAGNAAESVVFTLKNGTQNKMTATVPNVGSFTLSVNYECQGDLNKTITQENASHMVAFFKVIQLQNNADRTVGTTPFTQQLSDYDLSNAVMLKRK